MGTRGPPSEEVNNGYIIVRKGAGFTFSSTQDNANGSQNLVSTSAALASPQNWLHK